MKDLNRLTYNPATLLYVSVSLACVIALSIFYEFLPGILITGGLGFFLFFLYPTIPTFLLTFIFIISQEVLISSSMGLALQLPTEPFIVILGAVWVIYTSFNSEKKLTQHSFFDYAVAFYLATLALSVILSSHKIISLKFFINAFGYLIVCVYWTKHSVSSKKLLTQVVKTFFVFAILVSVFSMTKHSLMGFSFHTTNEMTEPFFEEHGTYAAYLSIIFGFSFVISLSHIEEKGLKNLAILTSIITIVAITLSYTRAAWLSCIFIIGLFFVFKAKSLLRNRYFWIFTGLLLLIFIVFSSSLLVELQRNALTILDVQRNVSNLERINRWVAAINMFISKPLVGFGVGTYPIHYYEFQNPIFSTIISDMYAGAHNDYLQYLAEGGIIGLSGWLVLLGSVLFKAFKVMNLSSDLTFTTIILGATLGISTYLFHALFNGYLEFDKVAVPFWLCIGLILATEKLIKESYQEQNTK